MRGEELHEAAQRFRILVTSPAARIAPEQSGAARRFVGKLLGGNKVGTSVETDYHSASAVAVADACYAAARSGHVTEVAAKPGKGDGKGAAQAASAASSTSGASEASK